MAISVRFTQAACAWRDGDPERGADLLVGPEQPDNDAHTRDLFGLFSCGALLTGRAMRKAFAEDAGNPRPFDGPFVLELVDGRSGLPAHPDDLPMPERLAVWAAAAGANLDMESMGAHLRNLALRGGPDGVCRGITTLVRMFASCWDGEPLG